MRYSKNLVIAVASGVFALLFRVVVARLIPTYEQWIGFSSAISGQQLSWGEGWLSYGLVSAMLLLGHFLTALNFAWQVICTHYILSSATLLFMSMLIFKIRNE